MLYIKMVDNDCVEGAAMAKALEGLESRNMEWVRAAGRFGSVW